MSGGSLQYVYFKFETTADEIEGHINKQGKEKDKYELYSREEFYDKYPEERFHKAYGKDVNNALTEAVRQIRKAAIYAREVEYFLSGDTGEDDFPIRLIKELSKLE